MRLTLAAPVVAIIAVAACGCQSGESTVAGIVKFKSKPLITGYVLIQFDDGNSANGQIATDGTYSISTPYAGHAKVAVGSPKPAKPSGEKRGGPPVDQSKIPDPANWVEIPAKYSDPSTSGKEATIRLGKNTLDIDLD